MDKVIIWVNENKEWFFSGIGVTIVTLIFAAIRKVFCKKKQEKKQGDLARALNVRPTTVSEWKTGKREPSAVFYAKIAEYFGVSLDYLITGRPPRDAPVQQIIGNNNSNNIANVAGNVGGDLTEYERELLKVCESFDMRHKTALLMYAYDLEKEIKKNKE